MSGVNKVIILGNLGKDPELRFMPNGGAVANLTIATSESWKDKQTGEPREKTEWHRVVIFGKLAEITDEYLKKGSKVYIEGSLQTRKWQNQQGQDQYTTEVVVQGFSGVMQMLDGKSNPPQQKQQAPQQQGGFSGQSQQTQQQGGFTQQGQQTQHPQGGGGFQQKQSSFAQQSQQQKVNPQEPMIDFDDDIPF